MTEKFSRWDVVDYLKTEEDIALYLEACLVEAGDDTHFIAKVLGEIVRARSMNQLAQDTGLSRDSLYRDLSGEGHPSMAVVRKIVQTLGMQWHGVPVAA